jgi:hypothetical protein
MLSSRTGLCSIDYSGFCTNSIEQPGVKVVNWDNELN